MGARRQTFGKVSIRLIFGERNRTQIPEKYAMLTHTHTRTRAHILRKHSSLIIRIRWRAQNNPNCNWHPPAYVGKSAYTHHPSLAHTHTHTEDCMMCAQSMNDTALPKWIFIPRGHPWAPSGGRCNQIALTWKRA